MAGRAKTVLGGVTALLWILVGVYFIVAAQGIFWQVVGGVALAFGVMSAVSLVLGLFVRTKPPKDDPF